MRTPRPDRGAGFPAVALLLGVVLAVLPACDPEAGTGPGGAASTGGQPSTSVAGSTPRLSVPPTSRPRVASTTSSTTTTTTVECARVTSPELTYRISARDNFFDPGCIGLRADQGIDVTNDGTVTHNFTLQRVTDAGYEEVIDFGNFAPGENTATEAFAGEDGPGPGPYRLYCKIHAGLGMEADLLVA